MVGSGRFLPLTTNSKPPIAAVTKGCKRPNTTDMKGDGFTFRKLNPSAFAHRAGASIGVGVGGATGGAMSAQSGRKTESAIGGGFGAVGVQVIGNSIGGFTEPYRSRAGRHVWRYNRQELSRLKRTSLRLPAYEQIQAQRLITAIGQSCL